METDIRDLLVVEFDKNDETGGTLRYADQGCWTSRNASTMHMLIEALQPIKEKKMLCSFKMEIYTGCNPPDNIPFACCKRDDNNVITTIPDAFFWNWPEIGILDYPSLVQQMLRASIVPPTSDKLFWIGDLSAHPTRHDLIRLAHGRADIQAEAMTWKSRMDALGGRIAPTETKLNDTGNFYSLPEHCQFKYLLDMTGQGYSGRLKILLFSGRPVFIQNRPDKEYFHNWLVPFEHYIPVEESLGDLIEKLEWAHSHEEECQRIGAAAQSFALQHLTRDSAIKYLRGVLLEKFHV
jgi:hypothetical protein